MHGHVRAVARCRDAPGAQRYKPGGVGEMSGCDHALPGGEVIGEAECGSVHVLAAHARGAEWGRAILAWCGASRPPGLASGKHPVMA
jgi:hypothetical protein